MLTLVAPQPESLWDESLPLEVKELPEDLAALDVLLADPELLWPLVECWRQEFQETGRLVLTEGRPTIALESYVRLMVLKARYRWGYRSLVAEVSDSIHLRRFCRISLSERVPDESTVRKLTRRIGPETVAEMTRALIVKATREKRFRPRAVRIDSTVIEADVKYPTDAGLASSGVRVLARAGRKLATLVKEKQARVRDRSRAMGHKLRTITRTIRRRSGEAKREVLKLTGETGELLERSITEARRLAQVARRRARGRGARAKLKAAAALEEMADRCEKVAAQIRRRVADDPIKDRIVSLHDPDARPIRKGKLGKRTEFGFVSQLAEVTEHTKRGARGLILPASTELGQPGRGDAAAGHRRRARPARDQDPRGRGGWRVQARADQHRARRPSPQDGVYRWPPGTSLQAQHTPVAPLPHRRGGPDQPPQTPLRARPIPPQRRRGPAGLD